MAGTLRFCRECEGRTRHVAIPDPDDPATKQLICQPCRHVDGILADGGGDGR